MAILVSAAGCDFFGGGSNGVVEKTGDFVFARFWGSVTADLRNRGVRDVLIACVDGLAGFADAITSAFPSTVVQRCVVHLIRNSLRPVARRDAAQVAAELRKIYTAPTAEAAFDALAAFAALTARSGSRRSITERSLRSTPELAGVSTSVP